ncbi:FAR-17a/AIG1-like protein [Pilobolus umbonatus]|nr:FAR-17a/AIG1-like protein [Pilobolus umbonatus]
MNYSNLLLVIAGLCSNLYALDAINLAIPFPFFGGHFQFLTILGVTLSATSNFLRIISLLTGYLTGVYEALTSVATPIECLVSVFYWPIFFYNKELLIPSEMGVNISLTLDLALHLIPAIVCATDLLVFNKGFKRNPLHILAIYTFAMGYYFWVNICYSHNGFWTYPLLALFKNDAQRGAFFILSAWICSLIYKARKLTIFLNQ